MSTPETPVYVIRSWRDESTGIWTVTVRSGLPKGWKWVPVKARTREEALARLVEGMRDAGLSGRLRDLG